MLEILVAVLAAAFLYGKWALHRSERWQDAGLCSGCGAEAPKVDVGGNHFCEVCAPAALKNFEVAGQFFAFAGTFLAIALSALLLEGNGNRSDDLGDLITKVGVASIFFLAVTWWILRRMKRKEVR